MGTVLGGKVAASGGAGGELAWAASWLRGRAGGRARGRPACAVRMRAGPRLAPLGWWVRSAGGGECCGEGILVCVAWRVELVGADVGPQRVPDPVGVHGDAVVVADEVRRA